MNKWMEWEMFSNPPQSSQNDMFGHIILFLKNCPKTSLPLHLEGKTHSFSWPPKWCCPTESTSISLVPICSATLASPLFWEGTKLFPPQGLCPCCSLHPHSPPWPTLHAVAPCPPSSQTILFTACFFHHHHPLLTLLQALLTVPYLFVNCIFNFSSLLACR